jgi:uncharacterized membrane protein YhiD involved in acid resistance
MEAFFYSYLKYTYTHMQHIFAIVGTDMFLNLFLAAALGMVIGVERFIAGKTAGMRTYTLIALG